jgi:hypothetical protein
MINEKEYKTLIMQENYDSNNTPFCPEFTSIDTVTECMTVITEQTIYEQEGVEILSPSNLTQVYDEVDLLKSSNAYLLLPSKGQIKFSPNLVGEQILYKFKGKSSIYISDCRIWTTLNSNGNVIETLHDVIDDARKIIDFLKQTSDVVNLDVTLKTDIDNAKNITNIMENDIFSANQIDSNLKININSAKNEDLVLNSIIKKANESNDILTNTNNISIETNTNLNTLIQNANNSKSELDVSMKNVDVIKNDLNTLTQNANTTITKLETDLANGNTTQIRTDLDNVMSGQVNPNLIANGAFETWDSSDWGILGETTRKTLADEFTAPRGKMLRIDFIADSNGQGVYKGKR